MKNDNYIWKTLERKEGMSGRWIDVNERRPTKEELEEMEVRVANYNKNIRLRSLSRQAIKIIKEAIEPFNQFNYDDEVHGLWNHKSDIDLKLLDNFVKSMR